jgi:hypothetical protein
MKKLIAIAICAVIGLVSTSAEAEEVSAKPALSDQVGKAWVGTWGTAAQHFVPGTIDTFQNQTLRLIVHISVAATKVRIRISNTFGDQPLVIGGAHIARRASEANIDAATDRVLTFGGSTSAKVAARSMVISDPVDLNVTALSDLAISLYFPEKTEATTAHVLAMQTSYISDKPGDATGAATLPSAKPIASWPFLTGVDVAALPG